MKVRCVDNKDYEVFLDNGKEYEGELNYNDFLKENRWKIKGLSAFAFREDRFEEVKENETMKELTLQEALNYPQGTKFEMGFDSWDREDYITVELDGNDIWYDKQSTILDMYYLKDLLEAKFYLAEDKWKEVSYYEAYLNKGKLRYIQGTEFDIVGTHEEILKELYESYTYYSVAELVGMGKWYIKEDQND